MDWVVAIDGLLWLANLAIIFLLAQAVYQQRKDIAEKLFLGMAISISFSTVRHVLESAFELVEAASFPLAEVGLRGFFHALWPVDIAALVIFASLSLHFTLVFPRLGALLRRWPRLPYLFYTPALALAGMMLTRLWLPDETYRAFWHLGSLSDDALQLAFVVVLLGLSVLRWAYVTLSAKSALVRQRMIGLLGGGAAAALIAIATDFLPDILGLPVIVKDVPGLRQLPGLIFFCSFAWAIQRHQILNVRRVLSRSLVYTLLSTTLTLLYLLVMFITTLLLQQGVGGPGTLAAPLLAAFVMAAVAMPLHDAIQRLMDRLFYGYTLDYRDVLREHSRQLTGLMSPTVLMDQILDSIETNLHPRGVVIALREGETFAVRAARGRVPVQVDASLALPESLLRHLQIEAEPIDLQSDVSSLEGLMSERPEWPPALKGMSLIVPFPARETLIGWMGLWPRQDEAPYTLRQRHFLATLANQSCVALQNAELYEKMKRNASELAVLNAVSTAITSSLDVDEVLQTIVSSVIRVIGCQKMAIYVLDEARRVVDLAMGKGLSEAFMRASQAMPLGDGLRTTTIVSGQPLTVPDIQGAPGFASIRELMAQEGIRAMAEVPLWGKEGAIGSLAVYYTAPHRFTGDEMELLTTLTAQAAIALENARLYALTDQALAQRLEELSAVLNSVHEGILMLDLQDHILMANPTVEELLETPCSQLVGRTLPEVVRDYQAQVDQPPHLQEAWQLPAMLEDDSEGLHGVIKDTVELAYPGHRILERLIASVEDRVGTLLGRVVVLRDITEEKELERMREDLSDMIVHDLRAPLAAIISGSTLLQEVIAEQDVSADVFSLLDIINTGSQRMLELVNSLLDISRMEAGRLMLDAEPFDLPSTVSQVVERLQYLSLSYDVRTEITIPPDFPLVWGDREKIARVFINLLDNAIKFTPAGGQVRISAQLEERDVGQLPHWAICSVLDTGPGILPEHRARIFDKFTQLSLPSGQRKPAQRIRGSGIGLNFCKLAVEAHGGRIWVETGAGGQGSAFKFTLPLADDIEADAETEGGMT